MRLLKLMIPILLLSLTPAQTKMNFELDYARFRYDSVSNYIEFYYLIDAATLTPKYDSSKIISQAILNFKIYDPLKSDTIVNNSYKFEKVYQDSAELKTPQQNQMGIVAYILKNGNYKLDASIVDMNDETKSQKISENLAVDPYAFSDTKISDIELAVNIKQTTEKKQSMFYKNSYEVTPNPSILYSEQSPVMFYYSELYNLNNSANSGYLLNKTLMNSRSRIMKKQSKSIKTGAESIVDVGLFVLKDYPTDTYTLVLELVDSLSNKTTTSAKKFFLYNPGVKDTFSVRKQIGNYVQSEFAVMNMEELDLMFDECKYISTEREIDEYESLRMLDAKREYLYNFWLRRDDSPQTPLNEFKNDYMQRVDFVNRNYGNFNRPGYKSERGRVYLMYGKPDDIERYPNEKNLKPYEIWTYQSIEGGVYFVFADLSGFSRYDLLHSTKNGEMKDEDWQKRITTE